MVLIFRGFFDFTETFDEVVARPSPDRCPVWCARLNGPKKEGAHDGRPVQQAPRAPEEEKEASLAWRRSDLRRPRTDA